MAKGYPLPLCVRCSYNELICKSLFSQQEDFFFMRHIFTASVLAGLSIVTVFSTFTASAMTAEEQKFLTDQFRYRPDTQIELKFVGITKDENYHPTAVGEVCLADYEVLALRFRGSMPLHHPKKGDIVTLPYQCGPGNRPLSPFSPYQWAKRLSNRRILMNTPWYLLDNTDEGQWVFGRGRGFVPVLPYGYKVW
jgi:hypothetical protein